MNRRFFLKSALAATIPATAAAAGYGLFEAGWVEIDRQTLALPRLPSSFAGTNVAFLTDLHHGPFTNLDYVTSVVRTTLALEPDLIVLGGDYSHRESRYIRPCLDVLSALTAPLGVYAVLGNHDVWLGEAQTKEGLAAARIVELTNGGEWISRGSDRFRLAGVGDLWTERVDVKAAVGNSTRDDAVLLLSHNPDLAETLRDPRVGLMLSGHTHGGQILYPGGAAFVPSRYGQKYLRGLVDAPETRVYVSRGLGTSGLPIRVGSRPEINLITLMPA
jgi:predicted MPP superfamily phosphohydrolase